MLGRCKFTFEELVEALRNYDEKILTEQLVRSFLSFIPTPEEAQAIQSFQGDVSSLAKPETFFYHASCELPFCYVNFKYE